MNHLQKIHVTFPVLNEQAQLRASILETRQFVRDHQIENFEICIADNGSTDDTESIGRILAHQCGDVKYLRLNRRGFGLALKSAWSQTDADYVGYMDLDLSTDLKHLGEVCDLIRAGTEFSLILGSRLKKGAKVEGRTLLREMISRGFNFLLRTQLGVGFTDGMCGFKFIKRSCYDRLVANFEFTDEWFFATQLAVRAEWMGEPILDLPVHWIDNPDSKSSARLFGLIRQYWAGIRSLKNEKTLLAGRWAS